MRHLLSESLAQAQRGPAQPVAFWANAVIAGLVGAAISGWLVLIGLVGGLVACFAFFYRDSDIGAAYGGLGKLALSLFLCGAVLFFLFVVTLLIAGIATFVIMAGSGFDFEAAGQSQEAWDMAMTAYQSTPGWQLAMAVFLFALTALLVAVVRMTPIIPASVRERRVVVLEALSWTRKQGVRHLVAALVILLVPIVLSVAATLYLNGSLRIAIQALSIVLALYGWCCLAGASYGLLR
ncbi:MAG: hypothetical protein MRY64_08510, partial [Hyphomonadaceae bacterium]|nr:hypothetical protein [Hyphomonadaceae bacterium]